MLRSARLRPFWLQLTETSKFYRWRSSSSKGSPLPLRNLKAKSKRNEAKDFVDVKRVRAIGGKGGDGMISFLQLWSNDRAGPDGGDGGPGGHVMLRASNNVKDLEKVPSILKGEAGEKGGSKMCAGKRGENVIIDVPIGTVVRSFPPRPLLKPLPEPAQPTPPVEAVQHSEQSSLQHSPETVHHAFQSSSHPPSNPLQPSSEHLQHSFMPTTEAVQQTAQSSLQPPSSEVPQPAQQTPQSFLQPLLECDSADLSSEGSLFILARGGAGGRGNAFFTSPTNQAPKVAQVGALGEDLSYTLEVLSIAVFGLIGLPNAGKSTLLQAISRARPKVAPTPLTTRRPHVGMVQYDDYIQIPVADLPGLVEGLTTESLRHAARCSALLLVVDASSLSVPSSPSLAYVVEGLRDLVASSPHGIRGKRWLVIANKIDLPGAQENLEGLRKSLEGVEIIGVSAKFGTNLLALLTRLREIYDEEMTVDEPVDS